MSTHVYTRALTDGHFDINNPDDRDPDTGASVPLAIRILEDAAFSSHAIRVVCNDTVATVTMTPDVTGGDITTLNGIVTTHQAAADPNPFPNGMPVFVPEYTIATVPPQPNGSGSSIIVVTDTAPDPVLAFHDGTSWVRFDGTALV